MVLTWTSGIYMESWYRHGLIVQTTPMVLTHSDGLVSILLSHTRMRGPCVARMQDFLVKLRYGEIGFDLATNLRSDWF